MFRGFRWQLVVLLTAGVLFAVTVAIRSAETPAPVAPTAPPPTGVAPIATAAPVSAATPQPGATPRSGDGVPTFREALVGVTELSTLLRQAVREQKAGEKEVQSVRQTLRSLQSVRI